MMHDSKTTLAEFARLSARLGFVAGYDGNLSIRTEEGILITSTRTLKSAATTTDICLIGWDGTLHSGARPASTERAMHLLIYSLRPEINGIVHAHPPAATAFAVARKPFDAALYPEVILDIGPVPLAPYGTPSTEELPRSLEPYITQSNGILLSNHGVVTYGTDLSEAFHRMEKLEHAAKTTLYATLLGGAVPLSAAEVTRLYDTHPHFPRIGNVLDCEQLIPNPSTTPDRCGEHPSAYLNADACTRAAHAVMSRLNKQ